MINYSTQPWFTHLPNCDFLSLYFKCLSKQNLSHQQFLLQCVPAQVNFFSHFVSLTFLRTFFKQIPAKQPFAQTLPHMLLPPSSQQQPSPHIELVPAFLEDNMGHAGSVALPKATCQADSHSDIYIVIPLLIALNKFIEGNRKGCWGKNGGIYDSQYSRLIHFLITGKYIGIACRVVKFKAKTNGKQCLLRTHYMEESV